MSQTILPSNNSPLMHALARLTEAETAAIDWRVITQSKDPAVCAADWLPWLAWENSISDAEGWRFAETEQAQRNLIAGYIEKHQLKGTPAVIRRLFRDLQLGEIEILERVTEKNGTAALALTARTCSAAHRATGLNTPSFSNA